MFALNMLTKLFNWHRCQGMPCAGTRKKHAYIYAHYVANEPIHHHGYLTCMSGICFGASSVGPEGCARTEIWPYPSFEPQLMHSRHYASDRTHIESTYVYVWLHWELLGDESLADSVTCGFALAQPQVASCIVLKKCFPVEVELKISI